MWFKSPQLSTQRNHSKKSCIIGIRWFWPWLLLRVTSQNRDQFLALSYLTYPLNQSSLDTLKYLAHIALCLLVSLSSHNHEPHDVSYKVRWRKAQWDRGPGAHHLHPKYPSILNFARSRVDRSILTPLRGCVPVVGFTLDDTYPVWCPKVFLVLWLNRLSREHQQQTAETSFPLGRSILLSIYLSNIFLFKQS